MRFEECIASTVLGGRIGFEEGRKTTIYKIETRGPNMIVRESDTAWTADIRTSITAPQRINASPVALHGVNV